MREQNNAQKLKQELEKSGNVLNVEIMEDSREIQPSYYIKILDVEFTPKGYSFELLQQQYPTLRVTDITTNQKGNIEAILKVNELDR